jgi:hypothetical protein
MAEAATFRDATLRWRGRGNESTRACFCPPPAARRRIPLLSVAVDARPSPAVPVSRQFTRLVYLPRDLSPSALRRRRHTWSGCGGAYPSPLALAQRNLKLKFAAPRSPPPPHKRAVTCFREHARERKAVRELQRKKGEREGRVADEEIKFSRKGLKGEARVGVCREAV